MKILAARKLVSTFCALAGASLCAAQDADQAESIRAAIDVYTQAWQETDAIARIALLERIWSEDSEYTDPAASVQGIGALSDLIHGFQVSFPNVAQGLTSKIDTFGGRFRFSWGIELEPGAPPFVGIDVGEMASDGKIAFITGFFGPLPLTETVRNQELAAAYMDALFNRYDLAAIGTLIAPDAVYTQASGLPYGGTYIGLSEWTTMFQKSQAYCNIQVVEPPIFLSTENAEQVIAKFAISVSGKRSNANMTLSILEYFQIENGKIAQITPHYFDTKALVDFIAEEAAKN